MSGRRHAGGGGGGGSGGTALPLCCTVCTSTIALLSPAAGPPPARSASLLPTKAGRWRVVARYQGTDLLPAGATINVTAQARPDALASLLQGALPWGSVVAHAGALGCAVLC